MIRILLDRLPESHRRIELKRALSRIELNSRRKAMTTYIEALKQKNEPTQVLRWLQSLAFIDLVLELERHVGCLEKRQIRSIVQLVEGVQRLGLAPALGFLDLQRLRQAHAEEILVELARRLRIAAAVGIVMQFADHAMSPEAFEPLKPRRRAVP